MELAHSVREEKAAMFNSQKPEEEAHPPSYQALKDLAPVQSSIALHLNRAHGLLQGLQLVLQHLFVRLGGLQKRGCLGLCTHTATKSVCPANAEL